MSNAVREDSGDAAGGAPTPQWHPIEAVDPTGGTDAERLEADRLVEADAVAGPTNSDDGFAADAQKFIADGLMQPPSVAGLTNTDDGLAADADRLDADGLN